MSPIFLLLPLLAFSAEKIPSRAKRLKAFEQAGLAKIASTLDELDQDILYMRAQNYTPAEMKRFYPKIAENKFQALKDAK